MASSTLYFWWGKNQLGHWVRGRMHAPSAHTLRSALRNQRVRVCGHVGLPDQLRLLLRPEWPQQLSNQDLTRLSRQLATLMQAGLPLLQSLRLMTLGVEQQPMGQLAAFLSQKIEAGCALHEAMRSVPRFDDTYCQLIAAGEASGQLERILLRLAVHREKSEALARRLRSALIYPCIILVVGLGVTVLLLSFVVPAFEHMFQNMGAELPALTQVVLGLSRLITAHGHWLTLGGVCVFGLVRRVLQTRWGREAWDRGRLALPLLRPLTQHAQCARWCRTLSTLLQAGIPIDEALDHLGRVVDHSRYQSATHDLRRQLTQGQALSQGLSQHPRLFDPLLVQMCLIGEESGTLDAMMERQAEHHEQAVDTLTQRLATLLEPSIMVVLGLTMGTLVLAMYWPIFQMGQLL